MRAQDLPVDPGGVREQVREVLSQREYRYEKSLLDRIGEWIGDRLEDLLGDLGAPGAGASFGGGAGSLVAWILIALAAVAVVLTIVYVVRNRVRRADDDEEPVLTTEVEHRHPAGHWRRLAEEHEAAGEWKEALRCRYRELVRTLVDRRSLPDVAGLTTGELRTELRDRAPAASDPFDAATLLFEAAWYAGEATGPEESARFAELAASVLDRAGTAEKVAA